MTGIIILGSLKYDTCHIDINPALVNIYFGPDMPNPIEFTDMDGIIRYLTCSMAIHLSSFVMQTLNIHSCRLLHHHF